MQPLIAPGELAALLDRGDAIVVDCRFSLADAAEGERLFDAGHIPGAAYVNLETELSGPVVAGRTGRHPLPAPEAFEALARSWGVSPGVQVVAYDEGSGAMAARLWWLLRYHGHDAVRVLDGGIAAWCAALGALTRERAPARQGAFVARVRPEMIADRDEVERLAASPSHRLLDARAPERFRGDVEPIDPVAGHIPGARNLPFASLLDAGHFKSRAALASIYEQALGGVAPEHTVAYCGSGVTACHLLLAAEQAGLAGMRLYPGSWSEWITRAGARFARGD